MLFACFAGGVHASSSDTSDTPLVLQVTQVRFAVLDVDSETNGIFRGDDLGYVETTVSEIVTARPNWSKKLIGGTPKVSLDFAPRGGTLLI